MNPLSLAHPFPLPAANPVHKHTRPRSKFTGEEDEKLRALVTQLGNRHWEAIAQYMPGRTARQCRDRYKNYLLDSLVSTPWTQEEDQILREKYAELGPKWVEISKGLNGRSGNDVKNRWYKHLSKWGQPQALSRLPPIPFQTGTMSLLAPHTQQGGEQQYSRVNPGFTPPFRNPFL
jgi:hypothetical protein